MPGLKLTYAQLRKIAYMYGRDADDQILIDFVNQHKGSASDRLFTVAPVDEPGFLGDVEEVKAAVDGLDRSAKALQKLMNRYKERNTPGASTAAVSIADSLRNMSISFNLDGINNLQKRPW